MARIVGEKDRRLVQTGPGKAVRPERSQTMDERIARANSAHSGTKPSDVRPLMDNDGDNDDD